MKGRETDLNIVTNFRGLPHIDLSVNTKVAHHSRFPELMFTLDV